MNINKFQFFLILSIIGLWIGFLGIGKTFAYFNDTENSLANSYSAATLDFAISEILDFSPEITPNQNATREINLKQLGNLDFEYRVKVENAIGTLCDYLLLKDSLTEGDFQPLNNFVSATTTFFNKSNWQFEAKLTSDDPSLQNKTCTFDFVFDGWQIGGAGFSDQEVISNTILSGVWQKVLINKVYYDVDNAHGTEPANEWIELYNPLDIPIDISGWFIIDNNGTDAIPTSSPIPAKGFAVITASSTTWDYWEVPNNVVKIVLTDGRIGNGLNNSADMLALKDNYGNIVDQMNWGTPTSTWPNYNLNLWDPGCGGVNEGHMLARVPTGQDTDTVSDWHDLAIPQVTVLMPSGGEIWYVGRTYTLEWSAVNPNGSDSDLSIDIWYSRDSGSTWANITRGAENDGQYDWRIPLFIDGYYVPSEHGRIKIVAFGSENFMVQGWGQSNEFCPPIDYSQLTEEEKAEVEILLAQGIISEDEIINRNEPIPTETEKRETDLNPEQSSTTDEAIPIYEATTTQVEPTLPETTTSEATSSEEIDTDAVAPDVTTMEEATSTIANNETVIDTASTSTNIDSVTSTTSTSNQTETVDDTDEEASGLTSEVSTEISNETTGEMITIEPTTTKLITAESTTIAESTTTEEATSSQETTTTEIISSETDTDETDTETTETNENITASEESSNKNASNTESDIETNTTNTNANTGNSIDTDTTNTDAIVDTSEVKLSNDNESDATNNDTSNNEEESVDSSLDGSNLNEGE